MSAEEDFKAFADTGKAGSVVLAAGDARTRLVLYASGMAYMHDEGAIGATLTRYGTWTMPLSFDCKVTEMTGPWQARSVTVITPSRVP